MLDLRYKPVLPPKSDFGIAVVGCGTIMTKATLPCYRKHGLNVVGCYDINSHASARLAESFVIPKNYGSLEELLSDPMVEIVEIAVLAENQLEIARKAAMAGKHLLCQKPLSESLSKAVEIVRSAQEAGIKLAVNQQMRWDQAIRSAKTLIEEGWIGRPIEASIQASFFSPIPGTVWADVPRYEVLYHSIHYIDSIRFLFGDPFLVTSRHAHYPLEGRVVGETKTVTILDHPSGLQTLIAVNMCNPSDEQFFNFRFIGSEGAISGTLGLSKYPDGDPDTLRWSSNKLHSHFKIEAKLEGTYLPDSFIGPISSLMRAIQEDGIPETDGRDNLNTLRIAEAEYLSAKENRSVSLEEIRTGLE
jgi:predicted dehydrogenase